MATMLYDEDVTFPTNDDLITRDSVFQCIVRRLRILVLLRGENHGETGCHLRCLQARKMAETDTVKRDCMTIFGGTRRDPTRQTESNVVMQDRDRNGTKQSRRVIPRCKAMVGFLASQ